MAEPPRVPCPYCGEVVSVQVDPSAGGYTTIEDCAVCCQPMELRVTVEPGGEITVEARRDDD
ncbi:MAG: hypothetical protein COW73_08290 [Nitrospirae bacterium CG18_big_fil_WC_8_21_14_2_50_70_55]|nr:CPXCG motif-containing cysteine-rich protein [Deltaproteobacteria bacterium]OIP65065.1 MAG: hypothetical protein AUK30_05500 [Nitrospirae bacterium CG2_30_70_394]PIQ04351.1 MAG: hypothetical protein COW73_08290 [Nitrospirae bacterium CG18_big_fil_WC_8_21_14_2_50_70_55]PIU79051.1 MAG: CPXCG motif-containing cysteine-rich protein [Nitrospirae bacterium CG06_land_8_20_14_3_00_70_43]PIW82455.1 MAG: CPXCG motif-containing cysteine-rich protein [Nitrospirae bacterium CG_4_8_14_3_um_filter_70_85]P